MQRRSTRTLAAVGALTGSLAAPTLADAQTAPAPTPVVTDTEAPAPWTGGAISGEEAVRLGLVEHHAAVIPESFDGKPPSHALRAAAQETCLGIKQCAFTGGYYTGPSIQWTAGHPETFWNIGIDACANSGTSGANWKNCASSIENDNPTYGFTVANNSGNYAPGSYKTVEANGYRDQLGAFDNNIEKSIGYGA